MKQEILARTIIETMINKSLRDIERDPDRSIRNLIDLGINFAKRRFQREFLQVLQEMMQNEQSAYYTLVKNLVSGTDHRRLKTMGMNIGFQACTVGATMIREYEDRFLFNIPWIYQVDFGSSGLPCKDLDKLIRQGKELGTFVYLLNSAGPATDAHIAVMKKHGDCAFVLLVTAEEILGDLMDSLKNIHNCLILVENDEDLVMEAADELRKHAFLYGTYALCPDAGGERYFTPAYLDQTAASGAAFLLLMPDKRFSFREDPFRRDETGRIRRQQEYPFIPMDFASDVQRIDRVISNDSCAVAFDAEGYVYTETGKWQDSSCNIRSSDLKDILNKVTKKSKNPNGKDSV